MNIKILFKNIFCFFFLLFFFTKSMGQGTGYVTLEGKQFKDENGNNFYPMVMNFNADIVHTPNTNNYYITSSGSYGEFLYYECSDETLCNAVLQDEFDKIKLMGFNTIRVGFGPTYHEGTTPNSRFFSMKFADYAGQNQWQEFPQFADIGMPNFNNSESGYFFGAIKDFLDQAEIADIKVILVAVSPGPKDQVTGIREYYPAYDNTASNDYANYLSKLATELANKPALLAYDLYNEPIYHDMYHGKNNQNVFVDLTKQMICEYERTWYDAIKPANDPNHLVTIGGASTDEIFYWDMGNLKLDFYSMHGYPYYNKFLYPTDQQGSITSGINRFKKIMYWMSQVCPMPWIIGETGFSADDQNFDVDHLDGNSAHHLPPFMYGSESQQDDFAEQSLDDARNAGASGYSWWQFQNVYWFSYNPPYPPNYPDCMAENYFGLLHYGTTTLPYDNKDAVTTFANYLDPVTHQPPAAVPMTEPAHYRDPFEIKQLLNTSATNAISGYVFDDKGNPIKDAVIYGTNWINTIQDFYLPLGFPPTPFDLNDDKFVYDSPFTFSHSDGINNGLFEIVPYNYYQPGIANPHRIINISITAVGAERDYEGAEWIYTHGYGDQQMAALSGPITLQRVTTGYDAIASNETVAVDEKRNYYGGNTLTAHDLILNGQSNLTARNEVHINTEFHAHASIGNISNETHIFISDALPECNDFTDFARMTNPEASNQLEQENFKQEIELNFTEYQNLNALIYPNPNNGIFTISIQNPEKNVVSINLRNMLAETLWSNQTYGTEVLANFDFLSKGIYFIYIKNEKQSLTKKLIIN